LYLASFSGIGFAAFWVAVLFALRFSRTRIHATDVLLLGLASLAVICNALLIWWFAPLALLVLLPYLAEMASRYWGERASERATHVAAADGAGGEAQEARPLRFAFTLVCLLIVWTAFAFSPASTPLFGRKPREAARLHNAQTPLGVATYLREHPPQKLVWAPQYWGDWLLWDGPAGMQVFANSDARILPQQVLYDYGRIWQGEGGWTEVLDRYDVGTLVIDKQAQPLLRRSVQRSRASWRVEYEDDQALLLRRTGEQVEEAAEN
jgi:hypothetical protein